jgi:hypothetical protein
LPSEFESWFASEDSEIGKLIVCDGWFSGGLIVNWLIGWFGGLRLSCLFPAIKSTRIKLVGKLKEELK